MLVNFSFYIQKFHDFDAEYRILLTTFGTSTYSRNIIKEGFLYSNDKIINKDQVVLDLPVNETIINETFEISIAAVKTARSDIPKGIKINIPLIEVDKIPVLKYFKKHIINNGLVYDSPNGITIPEFAVVSQSITAALVKVNDQILIQNFSPELNLKNHWEGRNGPIILNNDIDGIS
jgi:hypothetical protein